MIENEMNRKLLKPTEDNLSIILETNEILRIDKTAQSSYYSSLISNGVLSINEVRKEIGYNGIGEQGDLHFVAYSDINQNKINKDNNNEENINDEKD